MKSYPLYFDYNATTPCDDAVVEAMLPYFTKHFGNAASKTHAYGWVADEAVTIAREQAAMLIGAHASEIVFTSGATEAVNLAIRGVHAMYHTKGKHIITFNTEHKAVLDTCNYIQQTGGDVTVLPVLANGLPDLSQLTQAIRPDTILIAMMYANNETGIIMPVKEVGVIAKQYGVLFFCDATQAVGKIPVHVIQDEVDMLCFSAHKMYGPKGAGALYIRRKNPRVKLMPLQFGGGHERGIRSGTLNVAGIAGLGKACELLQIRMKQEAERLQKLRDQLISSVLAMGCATLNGDQHLLLPHVANISFNVPGAHQLIGKLNQYLAVSSGSACTSASTEPSYVLKAIGMSDELAAGSIRFSLGKFTTEEDIKNAIQHVANAVKELQDGMVEK
jgi:cysteine desulfurase